MYRIIIVEDEYLLRQMLREKLEQHFPDMEIVAESENAEDALLKILELHPDLLFLDIQMPGKNGLWLAEELMRMKCDTFSPPDIISTTGYAYSEYLLKAIELAAIDYIMKPVGVARLETAINRFRERVGSTNGLQSLENSIREKKLLPFKSFNGLFLFRPDDIVYLEADGNYACMYLAGGGKEDVFERLGEIEKKLPPETFLRAGKSFIINRKYVRKITDNALQLFTPAGSYLLELSRIAMRQMKDKLL